MYFIVKVSPLGQHPINISLKVSRVYISPNGRPIHCLAITMTSLVDRHHSEPIFVGLSDLYTLIILYIIHFKNSLLYPLIVIF